MCHGGGAGPLSELTQLDQPAGSQEIIIIIIILQPTEAQLLFYIICTLLLVKCDLPPLRPHCGEVPGRDSNPERVIQTTFNGIAKANFSSLANNKQFLTGQMTRLSILEIA